MRTHWYVAATCAALLSASATAAAQEQEEPSWFEPDAEAGGEQEAEAEPEVGIAPAPEKEPEPEPAKPRAPVTRPAEEHDGCDWHRGKHHRHARKPRGSRSFSLIGGVMRLEAPELTDALERAGFADPSKLRFLGLQGTRVLPGRLVLGLGASVGWSERLEREDGAGGRMLLMQLRGQLGYALVHTEKWLLYPALEVGLNHLELDIGAPGASSFDDALAGPRTGTELTRNSASAGGVVAIERRFPVRWRRHAEGARFFSIGLRAGWMRDLVASPWKVDGDGDVRGPEERQSIKYIGITLGFGQSRF